MSETASSLALDPLVSLSNPLPLSSRSKPGTNPHHLIVDPTKQKRIRHFAYQHRKQPTPAEAILWLYLRASRLGIPCRRQVPINGKYIADFIFMSIKLVVEVDGGYHQTAEQRSYDSLRTQFFERLGYRVIRVNNQHVFGNIGRVLRYIRSFIDPTATLMGRRAKEAKERKRAQYKRDRDRIRLNREERKQAQLQHLVTYARIKGEPEAKPNDSPPSNTANTDFLAVFSSPLHNIQNTVENAS